MHSFLSCAQKHRFCFSFVDKHSVSCAPVCNFLQVLIQVCLNFCYSITYSIKGWIICIRTTLIIYRRTGAHVVPPHIAVREVTSPFSRLKWCHFSHSYMGGNNMRSCSSVILLYLHDLPLFQLGHIFGEYGVYFLSTSVSNQFSLWSHST